MVSYSTNLDTLKLGSDLSLEQYRRIASNCLEVDCTVECDVEKIVDVMMGLQDRLVKLATTVWDEDVEVDGDDDAFYGGYYGEEYNRKPFDIHFLVPVEKLTAAALKCTRLRELNLSGEAQSMQNVLHAIAPQLRTGLEILEINSHTQDMPNDPEPWDPENVLPNLREFVFRCSSHSFECFLDLGRALPLIETVEIVGDAEDNDPYDEPTFAGHIFGGAVDALRYCLKDVYIGSVHSFEYHRLSHLWYLYKTESIIAEYKTKTPSPCVHVYGRRCVPGDLHLGW